MNFDKDYIEKALKKLPSALTKYRNIQMSFRKTNVSKDVDFQRRFNGFYRVRRSKEWQKEYYNLMEISKKKPASFHLILSKMKILTGRFEASFVSKMIATIDPMKPVIDKYVLVNFGLQLPIANAENRELKIVEVYDELCNKYELLMKNDGKKICKEFNRHYHNIADEISDLKKIDLVLWQMRG